VVDMNSTNTVHTGHYFRPYQINVDDLPKSSRGRESSIYSNDVISLLQKNLDKWFVISEYKFDKSEKKSIASKRSTYYTASKSCILKYANLEYLVRGETDGDTHTLKLMARMVNENQ